MNIKAVRNSFGWSRVEAAKNLGVSERTVEGWEHGRRVPDTVRILIEKIKEEKMEFKTMWNESGIDYRLMKNGDQVLKVEEGIVPLAKSQGAETIDAEFIDLSRSEATRLGLDWDE